MSGVQSGRISNFDLGAVPAVTENTYHQLARALEPYRPHYEGRRVLISGPANALQGALAHSLTLLGASVMLLADAIRPAPGARGFRATRKLHDTLLGHGFDFLLHVDLTPAVETFCSPSGRRDFWNRVTRKVARMSSHQRPRLVQVRAGLLPSREACPAGGTTLLMPEIFGLRHCEGREATLDRALEELAHRGIAPTLDLSHAEEYREYLLAEEAVRATLMMACAGDPVGQTFEVPGTHYLSKGDALRETLSAAVVARDEIITPNSTPSPPWQLAIQYICGQRSGEITPGRPADGAALCTACGFEPEIGFRRALQISARRTLARIGTQGQEVAGLQASRCGQAALVAALKCDSDVSTSPAREQEHTLPREGELPVTVMCPRTAGPQTSNRSLNLGYRPGFAIFAVSS